MYNKAADIFGKVDLLVLGSKNFAVNYFRTTICYKGNLN